MGEIVHRGDLADHHERLFRRLAAAIAKNQHVGDQDPEEHPIFRPVGGRAHRRLVEPGQEEEQEDRAEHRQHAPQLGRQDEIEGEGLEDRVERPEIPFGHDMRRRR